MSKLFEAYKAYVFDNPLPPCLKTSCAVDSDWSGQNRQAILGRASWAGGLAILDRSCITLVGSTLYEVRWVLIIFKYGVSPPPGARAA